MADQYIAGRIRLVCGIFHSDKIRWLVKLGYLVILGTETLHPGELRSGQKFSRRTKCAIPRQQNFGTVPKKVGGEEKIKLRSVLRLEMKSGSGDNFNTPEASPQPNAKGASQTR